MSNFKLFFVLFFSMIFSSMISGCGEEPIPSEKWVTVTHETCFESQYEYQVEVSYWAATEPATATHSATWQRIIVHSETFIAGQKMFFEYKFDPQYSPYTILWEVRDYRTRQTCSVHFTIELDMVEDYTVSYGIDICNPNETF